MDDLTLDNSTYRLNFSKLCEEYNLGQLAARITNPTMELIDVAMYWSGFEWLAYNIRRSLGLKARS